MTRKARISGVVTFLNDKGQRLEIPHQTCELDDGFKGLGPFILIWKDKDGSTHQTELSEQEYAHYVGGTKALKVSGL